MRSRREGKHVIRMGFPPGPRHEGSGKVLEILHPKTNPFCAKHSCSISRKAKANPAELLIFGNPKNPPTADTRQRIKATRERATRIRAARLTNPKMRRNPSDTEQAVKLFEGFHGRDAEKIVEAQRSAAMRLDYAACGPLVAVGFDDNGYSEERLPKMWDKCPHINFEGDKVVLASAPNGKQLYFIGGNQNLDSQLSDFKEEGVDIEKDLIDLGAVVFVVYEARKAHDNFEPADYCHRFGKGDQSLPRLAYDKVKKEMLLIGGEYFISIEAGLSPGIEG